VLVLSDVIYQYDADKEDWVNVRPMPNVENVNVENVNVETEDWVQVTSRPKDFYVSQNAFLAPESLCT
jgi:hypothetical protein